MSLKLHIDDLKAGRDLDVETSRGCIHALVADPTESTLSSEWLLAMRAKGETSEELWGLTLGMLDLAVGFEHDFGDLIDTCGMGGDLSGSANVSTIAAIVVAAAGGKVAKHGNRAASSQCGSADVLEALGVNIEASADCVRQCIREVGIGFLYARTFHPAMAKLAAVRREMGVPTVFNLLGPLTNPARPAYKLIGTTSTDQAQKIADVVKRDATIKRAWIISGPEGCDELLCAANNFVLDVAGGEVSQFTLDASLVGLPTHAVADIRGGDAERNALLAREVLAGKPSALADTVVLNGAAALCIADRLGSLAAGIELARDALDSGAATKTLESFCVISNVCGAS